MLMTEQIAGDLEGESSLDEMRRQRMPQDVRAAPGRADAGVVEGAPDDGVHRAARLKPHGPPIVAHEDLAGVRARATAAEIGDQRAADGGSQRQHQGGVRSSTAAHGQPPPANRHRPSEDRPLLGREARRRRATTGSRNCGAPSHAAGDLTVRHTQKSLDSPTRLHEDPKNNLVAPTGSDRAWGFTIGYFVPLGHR